MRMACLALSYKVLIIGVILAVPTDGESTPSYPANSGVNSSSTPDLETFTSHFISTTEETSTPSPGIVAETTSNSNSSYNYTFVTTDQYSNGSTNRHDNLSFSQIQERHVSDIPGNTSSTSTTDGNTSTEPQVLTGQTSKPLGPSAATTSSMSLTETSVSKKTSTWKTHIISTSQTTPNPQQEHSIAHAIIIAFLILVLTIILLCLMGCYLHRRKHRFSFDLYNKTADDVNIPLSSPMLSGGFESKTDQENNKEDIKVNEDKKDHVQASEPAHNLSDEINEKKNNCETEINHLPGSHLFD
ncbi:uncharacterized protein LOC144600787 isoform X2 [Rhinoraja longicauda]